MKVLLERVFSTPQSDTSGTGYTIGHLYIDGVYVCDTLEDVDRGLDQEFSTEKNTRMKIKGKTAIPVGSYKILMNVVSPRLSKQAFYVQYANGGRVPRLDNVESFSGVLIHVGNKPSDTDGCLLVGYNKVKGQVINSREAFKKVYSFLDRANRMKEPLSIQIIRKYKR